MGCEGMISTLSHSSGGTDQGLGKRQGWLAFLGGAVLAAGSLLAAPAAAGPYSDAVLAKNPFAYWRFNESSGASVLDSSGNNRHGGYFGGVLGQPGALAEAGNTAVRFSNPSHFALFNHTFGGVGWNQLTFEAWVKFDGTTYSWQGIAMPAQPGAEFVKIASNSGTTIGEVNGSGTYLQPGPFGLTALSGWHHLVFTTNLTEHRFYLDSVLVNSTVVPVGGALAATTGGLVLGNLSAYGGGTMNGLLDEVAIYRSVLSQTQIAQNFAAASQVAQVATPEPVSLGILALGMAALGGLRRGARLRSA